MNQLTFVTSNKNKFLQALDSFKQNDINLLQASFDIDEIQGEDPEKIARDKAHKAFDIVKTPLVISDDSWDIPGLNGFPGAYMKSINSWFTSEDFLRLTKDLSDRRILLHSYVVYQDENGQYIFTKTLQGKLLHDISPFNDEPSARIKSMTSDGRALAEVRATQPEKLSDESTIWTEVVAWIKSKK